MVGVRLQSGQMTNHMTPQLSRMDLPIHCATFCGLSLVNTWTVLTTIRRIRHLQKNRYWMHGTKSLLNSQDLFCSSKDWKVVSSPNIRRQHVRNSVLSWYHALNVFIMVSLDWRHLKRRHFHILLRPPRPSWSSWDFWRKKFWCVTFSLRLRPHERTKCLRCNALWDVRCRNRKKPIDPNIRGTHALVCWDLLVSFYFYNGRHKVHYNGRILWPRVAPSLYVLFLCHSAICLLGRH
jgi:hypothetical protein